MKRLPLIILALMMAVCVTACQQEEPKETELPPPPPPPPPTAEELAGLTMDQLNPLLNPDVRDSTQPKKVLNNELNKLKGEPNGNLANVMIANELKEKAKTAREEKQWHYVLVLCDLLELVEDSPRIERYREEATLEINRPKVRISAFIEDKQTDDVFWFLELTFPATGEVVNERHRVGDEFHGYEFLDIIGDRRGIRLKYKPTDAVYEIMKE